MVNDHFSPINILWIEDNPLWHRRMGGSLLNEKGERLAPLELENVYVPAINLTGELRGYERFFNLKVLQHPEEIREYFSLCLIAEDQRGPLALGSVHGAVPEMVVFDYKFFENIRVNQSGPSVFSMSYTRPTQSIREFINPNFAIKDSLGDLSDFELHLEKPESSGYDETEFIRRVYSPDALNDQEIEDIRARIKDDEFGLYAGIGIVKHFRNHACVGVPATANKAEQKRLHPLSRYYEWLHGPDLSTAIDRAERANKTWDAILRDGMIQLRKRIVALVQSGRITPSYHQLDQLSSGNIPDARAFSFTSVYGEKHLPLDGLFIDGTETIEAWAATLLKVLPKSNTDVNEAIEVSERLWDAYCEAFGDRILLSDYAYRADLTTDEKIAFTKLKKKYCRGGLIEHEYSIQEEFPRTKKYKNATVRLTVLLSVTRAAIELAKCKEYAGYAEEYGELTQYEHFNILYPKVNTREGLILPMHKVKRSEKDPLIDSQRAWLRRNLSLVEDKDLDVPWHEFNEWISNSEKILVRAIFFADHKYCPGWLK